MTIHSFRRVLKVRRHIHAIPWNPGKSLILPVPVPLLGLTYFVVLELVFILISRLPVIGLLSHLPWKIWWIIPVWVAWWALHTEFDGRMPHLWVRSWIAFRLRPKRTRGGVALAEPETRMRWRLRQWVDEHAPDLHRARVTGPATVHFNVPVRFGLGFLRGDFVARPGEYAPDYQVHEVKDRLEVKP